MSAPLLGLCAVIYLGVSVDYAIKGNPGMSLAFLAYAVANVGFILSK
jgi:hypothetical protein